MAGKKHHVVIVSDDKRVRWPLGSALLESDYDVEVAEDMEHAKAMLETTASKLVFLDLEMTGEVGIDLVRNIRESSDEKVILLLGSAKTEALATECCKMGAIHTFPKPPETTRILNVICDLLASNEIREEAKGIEPIVIGNRETDRFILGKTPKMREIFRIVERVAESPNSTVLIQGESGVGKELIAKAVHHRTEVLTGPFVDINCGSLPENLLESELFGHERGAFTDASKQKRGLVEIASGGTLFLDEIGEMPVGLQAVLLRMIETRRFRRVGGTDDIEVNLRIVAATNQDLKRSVSEKTFRKDLFFRLNVVPIHVPPLRERVEDIPILATYFIDLFNRELTRNIRGLSPTARESLQDYRWPGNVRELRNVIERAILLESEDLILLEHLPLEISVGAVDPTDPVIKEDGFVPISLSEAERRQILKTVEWARGNKTKAAKTLGISRQTLRDKLKQYDGG